jgi:quercetin dioxygenase-like cupin family protein
MDKQLVERELMTIMRVTEAVAHEMHGARFDAYVSPSSGSRQLCAWQVTVAPGVDGQQHRVSHEEVFLVLSGAPTLVVDGSASTLAAGDVAFVPAGGLLRLANDGPGDAALWVTTSVGLHAELPDGSTVRPPWTR